MFDQSQKELALAFARALAARHYDQAYGMLSAAAQSRIPLGRFRDDFDAMIPLDWGAVDPIALVENPAWEAMFLYVVLGGKVYSEAVIVESFATEGDTLKIERFQFGRP